MKPSRENPWWRRLLLRDPRTEMSGAMLLVLMFGTIASSLCALYVWADRPDASDVGKHSLSGWLVDTFGTHWAMPVGLALFSGLALFLAAVCVLYFGYVRYWLRVLAPPGSRPTLTSFRRARRIIGR
jgi:hypothetical protein